MASPFTVFRKNQKVLLAVTGILAMIAFVFLGTCVQSPSPVQAFDNPTVVSWKYGDITEFEMDSRVSMRRILNQFIAGARSLAGAPREMQPYFDLSEQSIVRSMVLGRRGRELGLVVSDDMVNQFLQVVTNDRVRPAELEQIVSGYKLSNQRVTPKQVFDALRDELLAERTFYLFREAIGGTLDTPAQRWENFRRLERQATVQVLPVPVAEFTDEVGKPSEEELRALFEKYKDRFASPNSPEPGFRQPYRAKFQYFKADIDELVEAEMKQIPEAEVREYYEKNKATQFRKSKLSPLDEGDDNQADDDAKKGEGAKESDTSNVGENDSKQPDTTKESTNSDGKTPATIDDAKQKSADATGQGDATAKPSNATATDGDKTKSETNDEANNTETNAAVNPTDDAAEDQKKSQTSDEKSQTSDKSADNGPSSRFYFAAFQDEKDAKEAPATATQPNSDAEKAGKSADGSAQQTPTADEKDGKSDGDRGPAAKDAGAKLPSSESDAGQADAAKESATPETSQPEPIEYRPLEQVEEEIRRTLARDRVQKQVDEKLEKLREEMSRYANSMISWRRAAAKNPDEPKPKPFELELLAEKFGVKAYTTAFLSVLDAENNDNLDIAASTDMNPQSPSFFHQWSQIVFQPKGLYRPITTRAPAGASFLSWKIEERETKIPEFGEVRAEVLEAWKRIKARDLAKKKAQDYASMVRQAKRPMAEVFAEEKNLPVKEIGPFAWLTRPNVPLGMMQQLPPLQYPRITGVELAGDEFMETTFDLAPGEVGVALNGSKAIAYVIQAVKFEPSDAVLEQEFLVRMRDYERYRAAGGLEVAQAQSDWMDSLLAEYAVDWRRPPDIRLAQQ